MTTRRTFVVVVALWSAVAALGGQQAPPDPQLRVAEEARTRAQEAYDKTDYEEAARLLDDWVTKFATPPFPEERKQLVIHAYELRARSRFNMGRLDEARNDFRQILLYVDPAYQLPAAVIHAGVRSLFDEVRRNAVGLINLSVTPSDAVVTIDGKRVPSAASGMSLPANTYRLVAVRSGFSRGEQSFTVAPGVTPLPVSLALDRVSSNLSFVTSPANVEVLVDGDSRGRTELDPTPGATLSKPFAVTDLPNGQRKFEFRLDCYRPFEVKRDITRPDDYPPFTVKLESAMGSIRVSATNAPGAQVVRNGRVEGTLPAQADATLALDKLCEGSHTIEVLSSSGRDVRRYPDLKSGQVETFMATLRPAFAIVSDSGLKGAVRGGKDYLRETETDFSGAAGLLLFAPDETRTAEFSKANTLEADWLKFDALGDRLGSAKKFGDDGTRDLVNKLSDTLNAQGIAAVTQGDPTGDPAEMLLILLARGSAFPDIIPWRLGDRSSARDVIARLDRPLPLLRSSVGMTPIDVFDVQGAVVAVVESGGGAESAGIRPGEIISAAGGAPARSASQLLELVASHPSGPLSLDVRDPKGDVRKVSVTVVKVPSLVSLEDESLLSNRLAVGYGALAAERTGGLEQLAARLNRAVVLMRLRNYPEATAELDGVMKLAEGGDLPSSVSDVVVGTTQYLVGICAEAQRDIPRAEQAWKRASEARGNMLTENGEPLKDLARRRLDQLRNGR